MNVILHTLAHVSPFRDYFLRELNYSHIKPPPGDQMFILGTWSCIMDHMPIAFVNRVFLHTYCWCSYVSCISDLSVITCSHKFSRFGTEISIIYEFFVGKKYYLSLVKESPLDCFPIPQICLDFLLRSNFYSKECPHSASIANRDFPTA